MIDKFDDTATVILKKIPHDLKAFWDDRAKMNDRSMNKEIIRLMEQEKARLLNEPPSAKDEGLIQSIIQGMHDLPMVDDRPMDEILYDGNGLPR